MHSDKVPQRGIWSSRRRVFIRSLCLVAATTSVATSAYADLPTVYVSGTRYYSQEFWDYSYNEGYCWSGPPMPPAWYEHLRVQNALKQALRDTGDVRCAYDADTRKTTSHSDLLNRQLSAQNIWRQMGLLKLGKSSVVANGVLTVTYADGGKEKWLLVYPEFSDGGINDPVPNSLEKGDNVIKPSPNLACRLLK